MSPSAQRYAFKLAASIVRILTSMCRRLAEQIAHGQCRKLTAGVSTKVVKVAVRRRRHCRGCTATRVGLVRASGVAKLTCAMCCGELVSLMCVAGGNQRLVGDAVKRPTTPSQLCKINRGGSVTARKGPKEGRRAKVVWPQGGSRSLASASSCSRSLITVSQLTSKP